jgi:nicotinamide phosphoribosyltransferase
MNPLLMADFYKLGHRACYPPSTTQVWSNWTARKSRVPGVDQIVFFGLRYFIEKYLCEEFEYNFFRRPIKEVVDQYREVVSATLGDPNPYTKHIEQLHDYGRKTGGLPIRIYALPEGSQVDVGVPALVVTNTKPWAFWLPNYLETILSNILWKPITSATTAREYRKICMKYARQAGETDFSFVDWQCHDFSMRGMSGVEDAVLSGMGHLLSFSGTDTIPAILAAHKYYNAPYSVGGSVNATEHSVMSAGGKESELETFRRLIEDVHPTGVVSIVSDTWDLWKVLTEYVPALRDKILARDGKSVFRPDSGDPVKILCGDSSKFMEIEHGYKSSHHPAFYGVLCLLQQHLGVEYRDGKLPLIKKAGAIYGDSITLERADQILDLTVNELRMSPYNVVLGIGSYTYELVTRDTYGQAMKATAVRNGDEIIPIWKDPVTDDGMKKSLKGIPAVYENEMNNGYFVVDNQPEEALDNCAYCKVYENGLHLVKDDFETIQKRARVGL